MRLALDLVTLPLRYWFQMLADPSGGDETRLGSWKSLPPPLVVLPSVSFRT